jgi:uncharacterized protein YfaA (DUF2138 family)
MIQLPVPQSQQLLAAVRGRLLAQMHSLDPTIAASAEMSNAHASEQFFKVAEAVFGECVTLFDADQLIRRACAALGYPDDGT